MNNTLQYKGDIEYQYTALWESIDDNLKNLIGKICRFRDGYVDIVWIKKWANPTIFSIFQDKLGHFFKKYGYNWYFFHDSFKIFIQEKTIMEWDGTINSMLSLEFHKDIADECQNSLPNSYWYWEEIYHRFNANEHEKVLKIATQSYFRNQLFNFRPINDIKIDIYFALKSAKMYSDSVALARLILIHMEIQEREHNLENELLISSLFKLKRFKEGLNYIHCKNQLKIDYIDVFKLIPHILNQGLYEEAKNIFNMAEPLNMIYYSDIIILDHQNKKEKLLQEWANVVIFFRNLDDILEIIDNMRNIKALFNPFKKQSDAIARNFRNKLFWNVLLSLSDDYEKNEILKIIAKFDSNNSFDYFINSRLKVIFNSYKKGKLDFAKYVLNETLNIIDEKQITPCPVLSAKISYFSYLVLNDIEKAENILKNIPNPYVIDLSKIIHLNTNLFLGIFEINRSWNLVFDEFPEIDFKYANESKEAIDKLKYLIDCFSFISTQILKNNKISEEEIINKFKCIIDYYYLVQNNSKASLPNSHRWYKFKDILNEFIIIFINIVKKDPFYVSLLQNILKREWNSKFLSWDNNLIREIILNIYNDDNKEWTIEQLNLIEAERDFNTNIYKGVEEFIQQAEAYYLLDEEGRLLKNFQTAIDRSFGIYPEKDYQLSTWIKWLNEYIIQYPFQTKNLVKNFAGKILALDENTDRRVISDAASQLLSTTLDWSPWNSLILSKFFFCHSLIYYEDVIENFLFKTLKNSDSSIRLVFLMTTYILLPISDHPPNNLINLLFDKINEIYGRNKVIDSGKFMVTKIKTIINRSKRPSFLKSISNAILNKNIDLIEINITKSDIYEKKNNQYNALELKDSTYLSETEVKEKLSSIKNFETLFGFEKENSYFHWEDVLEDFMKNLDENDKLRIIEIYKNKYKNLKKSRSLFVLTLFSDMTYEFDRDFSKKLAEEAFELSDKFGWSSRFDGGSRLASFKSLMKFDKKKTRNLLFDTFIEDVIAFKNVSVNLKEIISLVSDEIPIETIWPEINEHLTYLLKYNNTKTEGLEFKEISDDSHVKSLNHLLLYNLANPIAMISENSQKIIIDLLINNNEDIKNCINDFLNKKEFFQEKIVIILESVYIKNPKIVKEFHETLQSLKKSSNYVIRKTATILCKKIGD